MPKRDGERARPIVVDVVGWGRGTEGLEKEGWRAKADPMPLLAW